MLDANECLEPQAGGPVRRANSSAPWISSGSRSRCGGGTPRVWPRSAAGSGPRSPAARTSPGWSSSGRCWPPGRSDIVQTAAVWGVTHFLRVAALAHAHDLPVSPIGTTPGRAAARGGVRAQPHRQRAAGHAAAGRRGRRPAQSRTGPSSSATLPASGSAWTRRRSAPANSGRPPRLRRAGRPAGAGRSPAAGGRRLTIGRAGGHAPFQQAGGTAGRPPRPPCRAHAGRLVRQPTTPNLGCGNP